MIIDSVVIEVRSGKGGDGCVSFRREKFVPKGGPDGGDGGDGGSVILLACPQVETLLDFAGRHHWHAPNGQPGGSKQCSGRKGDDLVIQLPPGTQVFDHATGELLVDLDAPDKREVIAGGGRGGYGNEYFKGPHNQTPTQSTPGEPGTQISLRLELKLIADIGLVGLPNAGKSTLLSRISKARPKIADYPFTTINPQLGIAELSGGRRLVIADIPGLIENAHAGSGMGTRFLRHIERTRLLVHMIEVLPADEADPADNYETIRRELSAYSSELAIKPQVVTLSKIDLLATPQEQQAAGDRMHQRLGQPVLMISAATGAGIEALLEHCWASLDRTADARGGWGRESG